MEDQCPEKNELDKKFVIEEMYGTKDAFPSGKGATLVLAMVHVTYTPATQVPSSLESFASSSQDLEERPSYPYSPFSLSAAFPPGSPAEYPPEGMVSSASRSQRLEETFSNLCLQDSPCSSTPSSPVSTEESRCTWIFRNEFKSHAEIKLLRRLEREVQRLEQEGYKIPKINVELISNYAPCHECADEMIKFKETMEREGKEVSIKVIFANYYYWIGRYYTKEYGWKNLLKLKEMHDKGIDLQLLQGKESWESLFDSDLVNLKDGEKVELLKKATSEKRQEREDYDRKLRDEEKLF